ncbi:replication protein RepB (plasmid) [Rhodococcus ruber]|nr:replication protein RepB [Rhodococcus ruber]
MPAENPVRRTKTARELAAQLGVSERTIRNVVAEPRHEFEARARARRDHAVKLRTEGLKYKEIAEEMGISVGAVGRLLHDARKLQGRRTAAQIA